MPRLSLRHLLWLTAPVLVFSITFSSSAQDGISTSALIQKNYTRQDYQIPMRDGVKLYTTVYSPKDQSQKYPIIMSRTPYSVPPYEKDKTRASLGPNRHFVSEGY